MCSPVLIGSGSSKIKESATANSEAILCGVRRSDYPEWQLITHGPSALGCKGVDPKLRLTTLVNPQMMMAWERPRPSQWYPAKLISK
ncbi:hypothetical protein ColTof4_04197 [Colletotrichum tofieldiae]|nr:hypothetical protein ColTof3_14046 [Colletotrichum tofieldiae]GKT71774.1 hypothetical protein ColTof4_04197 [Colletotrichum tofieldiae]